MILSVECWGYRYPLETASGFNEAFYLIEALRTTYKSFRALSHFLGSTQRDPALHDMTLAQTEQQTIKFSTMYVMSQVVP